VGRPRKDVDKTEVAKLASYGCTNTEIADFTGVSESTIRLRFNETLIKERAGLKGKSRKAQIDYALKGNATLLIWLGKQMLDQKDGDLNNSLSDTELQKLKSIANSQIDSNL